MHKKFGKDRSCGADRQTDTQTYSSQYSATAPASKVKTLNSYEGND